MHEENLVSPCKVRLFASHIVCNDGVQNRKCIRQTSMLFNRFLMRSSSVHRRLDSCLRRRLASCS